METCKPHYNIVFSIPIHERFDVVVDQCVNFFHFNPNCAIVFHISKAFNYKDARLSKEEFLCIVERIGNIYINPQSLRTGLLDIIQAHLSNFEYINTICDFDFYSMAASNDLFIREGVYDEMKCFDAGLSIGEIKENTTWDMGRKAQQDPDLKNLLAFYGGDRITSSQVEGSYYKKDIFQRMCIMINQFYDYNNMPFFYARDEIYFSTVLLILAKKERININKQGKYTWINWTSKTLFVGIKDVKRIVKEAGQYYCVKRCDRDIDNVLRAYVRQNNGYYDKESSFIPDLKFFSNDQIFCKELIRNISNCYDKLIYKTKVLLLKLIRR